MSAPPHGPDVAVYAEQTVWLVSEILANLQSAPHEALTRVPPGLRDGNTPLVIANHAAAVTVAYALGMGCGQEVSRDRAKEFSATEAEIDAILGQLRSLIREIPRAFASIARTQLDRSFVPEQALYGSGEPRQMTARSAIVENIRHMGIHLGEIRLTRSLLENG